MTHYILIGPLGRRQKTHLLTLMIVMLTFLLTLLFIPPYHIHEVTTLPPGGYQVYKLQGTQWSMVHFSVNSSGPVTICITNLGGMHLLRSGKGVLCLFNKEDVTHMNVFWRFPQKGPLYMLVVNPSENRPVKVSISVTSGILVWGSYLRIAI